jgi:RimJ/RimL family protein N-acetyltransferase
MAFPEHVVTERLVLHRWGGGTVHASALAELNARPEAVRFLNAGVPYTPEESAGQSARFAEHWHAHGFGLWAVEAHRRIVGFTGVCHPRWFPAFVHEVEIGWRLHPSAWGNGYATEAGRAAVDAAFAHLDLDRVLAFIDPGNDASTAVAVRLGFAQQELVDAPGGPVEVWELRHPKASRYGSTSTSS